MRNKLNYLPNSHPQMEKLTGNMKEVVRQKYSEIARGSASGCCEGSDCCGESPTYDIMAESYESLSGYNPDADLSLGCGIPVEHALLAPGQKLLDLGSGAGNDLFVARSIIGNSGHLTGLDFSQDMIDKAEKNRQKLGFENMTFINGDIEDMPFEDDRFDVVLSNCVLNLVPNKTAAYSEVYRVLKPGGHFTMSDIVLEGQLSEQLRKSAELYAGCVSGAIHKQAYLKIIDQAGFVDVTISKERSIEIPDSWLKQEFGNTVSLADAKVLSITVRGYKSQL